MSKGKTPVAGFQKGKSGNPTGRPKRTEQELDLIKACREKAPQALDVILRLMTSADKDSVKLAAATYIHDRGFGKAPNVVELSNASNQRLTDDELTQRIAELAGKLRK